MICPKVPVAEIRPVEISWGYPCFKNTGKEIKRIEDVSEVEEVLPVDLFLKILFFCEYNVFRIYIYQLLLQNTIKNPLLFNYILR